MSNLCLTMAESIARDIQRARRLGTELSDGRYLAKCRGIYNSAGALVDHSRACRICRPTWEKVRAEETGCSESMGTSR